jgi:Concanavalin A-like lectin/glucanases superfamily
MERCRGTRPRKTCDVRGTFVHFGAGRGRRRPEVLLVGAALALLGAARPAHANVAHGNTCVGGTTTAAASVGCTWSGATTANNLLVAVLTEGTGTFQSPTTDGAGWTQAASASRDQGNLHVRIYYNAGASSRSGAVSWSFGASVNASLIITEYNGMLTSSPLDKFSVNGNNGSTTASTGTSGTLTQGDEIAVAAFAALSSTTALGAATGFSQVGQQTGSTGTDSVNAVFDEDIIVNSTAALSPSVSVTPSTTWAAVMQTFKVSTKTFSAVATANWSTPTAWTPSGVPGSSDTVILTSPGNVNLVIDQAADVAAFYVRSGYTSAISTSGGPSIRVRGDFVLGGGAGSSFTSTTGTLRIDGAFNRSGSTTFAANAGTVLLAATSNQSHAFGGATFNHVIVNDGLVAYWKLDEGTGTALNDASGFASSGVLNGGTTWVGAGATGASFSDTNALTLDGTSGYATLTTTNLPGTKSPITISLWAKFPAPGTANQNMIALVDAGSSSALQVGLRGTNLVAWSWGGGTLAGTTAPTDALWHHVAYTFDGNNSDVFYLDGVAFASNNGGSHQSASTTTAYLGTYNGGAELYGGSLDDVRVYNRALSATEVSGLAAGSQPSTAVVTHTFGSAFSTSGDFVQAAGAVAGTSTVSVGGNWMNYGGQYNITGAVTLAGTGGLQSGGQAFSSLTISSGTVTLLDRLWMPNLTVSLTGTAVLNGGAAVAHVGAISKAAGATFTPASGTVVLDKTTSQTLSIPTFNGLRIEGTTETNLVGYWKADESTGRSLTDWSGNNNTGTLSGGMAWSAAVPSGVGFDDGGSIRLDGSSGFASLGITGLPGTKSAMTISFWAKFPAPGGSNQNMIALVNSGSAAGLQVGLRGASLIAWSWGGSTLASTTAPTDGAWHHVAYTFDGANSDIIYLDGVATAANNGANHQTAALTAAYLGTYNGGAELYGGSLDDVRIYNTNLSATQVSRLAAGRYPGTGGAPTVTLGANLTVNGTLAVDNGTLATSTFTVNAAATDATKVAYVNSGALQVGSATLTFNGGLTVQSSGSVTEDTAGGAIALGAGKTLSYFDTAGSIEGFPTASFNWTTFAFWREYIAYRSFSGTTDRLLARSADGGTKYFWDLPAGVGNLLGTPRWNMEGANHFVYLVTTLGSVYKVQDTGSALTTVAGWPYRNGASATATSPLANDATNLYWCGNDGSGAKKMFSLTLGETLNNTRAVVADVVAAPLVATVVSTSFLFVATANKVYKTPLDVSSETTTTQPTTTVNGRLVSYAGSLFFPEDNGKVWALSASTLATSWSYQDTDSTRHPGGCTAASQCTVKNIYFGDSTQQLFFGDNDGHVYVLGNGVLQVGYPFRPGTSADQFQVAPLARNGVLLIGAANGNVYEIDANTGSGPALTRTYTLSSAVSSIAFNNSANAGNGAYTIGTADGKLYYIVAGSDPTPSAM